LLKVPIRLFLRSETYACIVSYRITTAFSPSIALDLIDTKRQIERKLDQTLARDSVNWQTKSVPSICPEVAEDGPWMTMAALGDEQGSEQVKFFGADYLVVKPFNVR
jgi:hypothetical protein